MQAKMTKQVSLTQNRLSRELDRLEKSEKSMLRMLECDRRRFRMKHQKLKTTMDSKAMGAQVHGTHNPAVSYDDDALDKSSVSLVGMNSRENDFYETIRDMLFTDGEVDVDKIFCLHLLTAHAIGADDDDLDFDGSISSAAKKELLSCIVEESENDWDGALSDILPCYIVEAQRGRPIFHKTQSQERVAQQQDEAIREKNEEFERVRQTQMLTASALGKIPFTAPHPFGISLREVLERDEKTLRCSLEKSSNSCDQLLINDTNSSIQHQSVGTFNDTNSNSNGIQKKIKNYFYLHPSYASTKAVKEKFKIITICINSQLKLLIRIVLEVLQIVNEKKMKIIFEFLKDPKQINLKFREPKIQLFLQDVREYSLIASPENFKFIPTFAVEVSDVNFKSKFRKYVVAKTLEVAPIPGLYNLLATIRINITSPNTQAKDNKDNTNSLEEKESLSSVPTKSHSWEDIKTESNSFPTAVTKSDVLNHELESVKSKEINNIVADDRHANSKKKEDQQVDFNVNKSINMNTNFSSLYDDNKVIGQTEFRKLKTSKDLYYSDPDRTVLRRMTHTQRILVGQMCASLKTKKINNEGFMKEKIPILSLISPVLSRDSIRNLTQGTIYAQDDDETEVETEVFRSEFFPMDEKLTSAIILKLRHEVAEIETRRNLEVFMKKTI